MSSNTPVEIPKSHRNEWKSKRNSEELIEGLGVYMPFGSAIRDYGVDGQVEITRPIKDSVENVITSMRLYSPWC